ncbi:MAG: hypothetical protein IPL83_04920 [Bdellovibrionales bacterium]|nr:hypothetical protein [Bdellovibrionales bacterium]
MIAKGRASRLGFALVTAVLFFQNCSDVRLKSPEYGSQVSQAPFLISALICPQTDLKPASNTKFIFMIDMSVSNIGGWIHQAGPQGQRMSYWDSSQQTDIEGVRFDYLKEFLNGCGAQFGNQFSIMGMSHSAGTIVRNGAKKVLSCDPRFQDQSNSNGVVDAFKLAQQEERPWYEQWTNHHLTSSDWPGILGATSYSAALSCSENLISQELTSDQHLGTETYHLFMVSDGVPNDGYQKGCNLKPELERKDCYLSGIADSTSYLMQLGLAKNKTMRIHAISYGGGGDRLEQVEYMDTIARYGNTGRAVELARVSDFSEALCRAVASQAAVDYQADFVMAINMTTIRRNGQLLADSDMDGLPDGEEIAKGFDPLNPRSQVLGVLDGICDRLGGVANCQQKRSLFICESTLFNSAGLSDCDIKILELDKLGKGPSFGLDTDGDGMPDLIELVKGTDPVFRDMNDDPDGDGQATQAELLAGTDPFANEGPLTIADRARIQTKYVGQAQDDPTCNFGAWRMDLEFVPVSATSAVTQAHSPEFAHGENTHLLFLFYRLNAMNANGEASRFFGTFQQVQYSFFEERVPGPDGTGSVVLRQRLIPIGQTSLKSQDFKQLGETLK